MNDSPSIFIWAENENHDTTDLSKFALLWEDTELGTLYDHCRLGTRFVIFQKLTLNVWFMSDILSPIQFTRARNSREFYAWNHRTRCMELCGIHLKHTLRCENAGSSMMLIRALNHFKGFGLKFMSTM